MKKLKVIITGATGMVGEGVLFECISNDQVEKILVVGRRPYGLDHKKIEELIIPDFLNTEKNQESLQGYDACFFCAGKSVLGLSEKDYTRIIYDTTLHFATVLLEKNPEMVFNYVSGQGTDTSEQSRFMWARVKGKTENSLIHLGFKGQYNFRPGFLGPVKGQKNVKWIFRFFDLFYPKLLPGLSIELKELGRAMIEVSQNGYDKQVLEIPHIKALAKSHIENTMA